MRRYIGQSKVAVNAENIKIFSGRGDWLSGTAFVNSLASIFERLTGIPVPRSVGAGFHLPNLPNQGKFMNHIMFYEEMAMLKNM